MSYPPLHALIGVRRSDDRTFYVRRSTRMENYPGVWSLLSIQYDPHDLVDPRDLDTVSIYMRRMSAQRLGGVPITTKSLLLSGNQASDVIRRNVFLHLYHVELHREPVLNPAFYMDCAWLTPEQYAERAAGEACGLCLRLWASYGWMEHAVDNQTTEQPMARYG